MNTTNAVQHPQRVLPGAKIPRYKCLYKGLCTYLLFTAQCPVVSSWHVIKYDTGYEIRETTPKMSLNELQTEKAKPDALHVSKGAAKFRMAGLFSHNSLQQIPWQSVDSSFSGTESLILELV